MEIAVEFLDLGVGVRVQRAVKLCDRVDRFVVLLLLRRSVLVKAQAVSVDSKIQYINIQT